MQQQRRRERPARVECERQIMEAEYSEKCSVRAPTSPAAVRRLPGDARDPRQIEHVVHAPARESAPAALLLRQVGEPLHPALERQAETHQVTRQQVADAAESAARVPQPRQADQQQRDHHQRLRQRQRIVAVAHLFDRRSCRAPARPPAGTAARCRTGRPSPAHRRALAGPASQASASGNSGRP